MPWTLKLISQLDGLTGREYPRQSLGQLRGRQVYMSLKAPKKILKDVAVPVLPAQHIYEFGPFRLDPNERQMRRDGAVVPITAKAFDTLLLLVQKSGHLFEKSEIMQAIWPDSFVEEGNLSVTIHMLRKTLGDDTNEPKYIETLAKRGYRFVGHVNEVFGPERELGLNPSGGIEPLLVHPTSSAFLSYRLAVVFLAVIAVTFGIYTAHSRYTTTAGTRIQSLSVLPFRTFNRDPTQDYLGLAMADAIATTLGSAGNVIVRPTNAVTLPGNSAVDPVSLGRQQHVDAILAGSIERLPDRVRVTAQLTRVSDGSLLWAQNFEEPTRRMYALEEEVESKVEDSLSARLNLNKDKDLSASTGSRPDFDAYQLYLQGRYFWNKRTEDGLRRSIEYFQQATIDDPNYAKAYAGLADSYALLGSYGVEPAEQAYPSAKSAALKAVRLDDSLSEAHTSLAMISFYYEWNWRDAEHEFRRSIELNSQYAIAHTWYAISLAALGRNEEAVEQVQQAQALDPLSLIINTEVGRVFYLIHDYDQSVLAYRKVIDMEPQFARAHARLGMTYAAENKFSDAIQEFNQAQRLSGSDPYLDGLLGYAQARSGDKAAARNLLARLQNRARNKYVPAYSMALICIGLGDRDLALELLSKSYADRSTYMVYAKMDPLLDSVRTDPKFTALLKIMHLA